MVSRGRPLVGSALVTVAVAAVVAAGLPVTAAGERAERRSEPVVRQDAPQPPEQDPFYRPPDGFESAEPGAVLRSRKVTVAAAAALPLNVQAWQLLYRTTDNHGAPSATVTTVMLPGNAEPDRDRPLLSYQTYQNSIPHRCAPSYQFRQSFNWDNAGMQVELVLIAAAVRQGWAVTVPDHLGQQGAHLVGRNSAYAALDGIRAAENFQRLGLNGAETRVGMWGYSGGGYATGWAARLQREYAPELNVVGAATGGVLADLGEVHDHLDGGLFSGIMLNGIAGLSVGYPELREFIADNATPQGREAFATMRSQCLGANTTDFAGKNIEDYFIVDDPLHQPVPQRVHDDIRISGDGRTPPMFVYHSAGDQLVPIGPTDELVRELCAGGNSVRYQRDFVSEHFTLTATAAPDALEWLKHRLDGRSAPEGCATKNVVSSLASPKALAVFGKTLLDTLIDLTGRPIGPS